MKKICHISINHPRYDQRIVEKECLSLKMAGYDVYVIANDNLDDEVYKGIKIISIDMPLGTKLKRFKAIKRALTVALDLNADIYHIHEPDLLMIALKLKAHKKIVIFDSHEYYRDQINFRGINSNLGKRIIRKIYTCYEKYYIKRIDAVIFPTDEYIVNNEIIAPFRYEAKKVIYIGNYPKDIILRKNNNSNNKFTLCYAGRLSDSRGITNLIQACYKTDCKLILAGIFDTIEYKNRITEDKCFSCVDYLGRCSLDEVYNIYSKSDVGVSLLKNIGQYYKGRNLPTKLYEYMQCSLPIICNDSPYIIELNEKYNFCITVNPDNIDEIVKAIMLLKDNSEYRKKLGENGYKLMSNKFKWENDAQKLIEFYDELEY